MSLRLKTRLRRTSEGKPKSTKFNGSAEKKKKRRRRRPGGGVINDSAVV